MKYVFLAAVTIRKINFRECVAIYSGL